VIEEGLVDQIRAELPELPDDKCRRLVADYDLPLYDAQVLVDTYGATHFFEAPPPLLSSPLLSPARPPCSWWLVGWLVVLFASSLLRIG
jgi:Asp-tRNA(Asn)/Glu-tRNA(Gln) amidotransferase B subunit